MLKNVAKTGMEVADDVIEGRSFVDSVKKRVPTGIKRGVEDIVFQSVPAKRQREPIRRQQQQRRRRRQYQRDIFS